MARGRAAVVVLGDVGRSPRMQYHALSLANQAHLEVDVVGYAGSQPHAAILEHPRIHLHLLKPPWTARMPRALYLLTLPLKLLIQVATLLWALCVSMPAPDFFLLQNPPSIPTLTVVQVACWLRRSALIIDWHNFGYTLLALTLGASHPLVVVHKWYERRYGQRAAAHICVTRAMQHELKESWGIPATVLYDRPPEFFRPATLEERHKLFRHLDGVIRTPMGGVRDCCSAPSWTDAAAVAGPGRQNGGSPGHERWQGRPGAGLPGGAGDPDLAAALAMVQLGEAASQASSANGQLPAGDADDEPDGPEAPAPSVEHTLVTTLAAAAGGGGAGLGGCGNVTLREGRPAVIVSSTSWTADEDFGMLLETAVMYDRRVSALLEELVPEAGGADTAIDADPDRRDSLFPRLLFIITGKGPMKAQYERQMARLRLRRVAFRTAWLEPEDYPALLGSADLGVCLHTSSSGLDLPMKVVDMFGCGLPVCAVGYSCIDELVHDRKNGLVFSSSSELADALLDLFKGFPDACDLLKTLRDGALASSRSSRWNDEWAKAVLPLLTQHVEGFDEEQLRSQLADSSPPSAAIHQRSARRPRKELGKGL